MRFKPPSFAKYMRYTNRTKIDLNDLKLLINGNYFWVEFSIVSGSLLLTHTRCVSLNYIHFLIKQNQYWHWFKFKLFKSGVLIYF